MRYKLQRAYTVCHTLQVVALAVCEVVHGIGIPLVSRAPVLHVQHTVHDWVAEMHVGTCHVYLGTQYHPARLHIARVHLAEQPQRFLGRTVAVRALRTRFRRRALLRRDLLGCLLVHVCTSVQYAPLSKVPQVLEIVTGIYHLAPFEAQPLYVALYGTHVFDVLLLGICVVHAQVAYTAKFLRNTEVHCDSLGMTYVQVAVRFGWETRLQASAVLTLSKILHNTFLYKIQALFRSRSNFNFCHIRCSLTLYSWQKYKKTIK